MKSCIDCSDRQIGCHSTCRKYAEEKKQMEERKEMIRKAKQEETPVSYILYKRTKITKERREKK